MSNDFRAIFTNPVPLEELVFQVWDRFFGGAGDDRCNSVAVSPDGGLCLAGQSESPPGGNKTAPHFGLGDDAWFVRLDADGNLLLDESYGGTNSDRASVVRPVTQAGWILGGSSSAGGGGNKNDAGFGLSDFWIKFRLYDGQRNGDVSFGGAGADELNSLEETADEGFIMAGSSSSGVTPGNVNAKSTPNLGGTDFWVVRGSLFGTKVWERTLGGSSNDIATSVKQTRDGGFIVGGTSSSGADGNKTAPPLGGSDFWVVRLDSFGNTLWDRGYGTATNDRLSIVLQTADGGYLLGGDTGPVGLPPYEFLIIRLDVDGNELWRSSLGGIGLDLLGDLRETPDGGFLVGGYSLSQPGGAKTAPQIGRGDFWLARLDAFGGKLWDASFGGTNSDRLDALTLTPDGALLAGYSTSDASGTKTAPNFGGEDFWTVKVAFREAPVGTPVVFVNGHYARSNSSLVATLTVLAPAEITAQPASLSVPPGTNVTFCVGAQGTPPVLYQWRLNGLNIPGATNSCFSITNVQVTNGGSYTVVVANEAGAATSEPAVLIIDVPPLQAADLFADRVALNGNTGTVAGTNAAATREPGEPSHAGKPGGKSLWYLWRPAASGIAAIDTRGSGFDTLLAVFTGASVGALSLVAADEDSGGFYTSLVKFNVIAGTEYAIAIDGFGGASGRFVLHWEFEASVEIIPAISNQPQGVATSLGGSATFTVGTSASQPGLAYQWLFNGVTNIGATNHSLTVTNVGYADLGDYTVRVGHPNNPARFVESVRAALEIGPVSSVVSYDKLEDLLNAAPPPSGGDGGGGFAPAGSAPAGGFIALNLGSFNGQVLGNTNSGTQAREPNHCNFTGNDRTRWFGLRAFANGVILLDTAGSGIQTVMTVYNWTNYDNLAGSVVGCDIDTNLGSRVVFTVPPLAAGRHRDYLVAVDSIGPPLVLTNADGSTNPVGLIRLNWRLGLAPLILGVSLNQFIAEGSNVFLSVLASNRVAAGVTNLMAPPRYQWSCNGLPRPGATNATLALNNVRLTDAGVYRVTVRNDIDLALAEVRVAVLQPNLSSRVVSTGDSTTLGMTLAGDAACALGYQWLRNGQPLPGRTGPTLSIGGASLADAGQYSLIATNCFGSITSVVATVSVAARFRVSLGALADAGEFRFLPTSFPFCGVVLEWAPDLRGPQTPWQPFMTNFHPQAVLALPLDAAPGRFYRARLLFCP